MTGPFAKGKPPRLQPLLRRLKAYQVNWKFSFVPSENAEYEPGIDREVAELDEANVISSELIHSSGFKVGADGKCERVPSHAVLLDLDIPAYLISSSTPGHSHLYIDVPGGVPHHVYMELLEVLARAKVIELGYAQVSIARGHSDLRLPWVSKSDQKVHDPDGAEVNLKHLTPPQPDPWDDFPDDLLPQTTPAPADPF